MLSFAFVLISDTAFFEPTSNVKATRFIDAVSSDPLATPLTHITPNIFELRAIYDAATGADLFSSPAWFAEIDRLGVDAAVRSKMDRQLPRWLLDEGLPQMGASSVLLLETQCADIAQLSSFCPSFVPSGSSSAIAVSSSSAFWTQIRSQQAMKREASSCRRACRISLRSCFVISRRYLFRLASRLRRRARAIRWRELCWPACCEAKSTSRSWSMQLRGASFFSVYSKYVLANDLQSRHLDAAKSTSRLTGPHTCAAR